MGTGGAAVTLAFFAYGIVHYRLRLLSPKVAYEQ
jgi:hypothetical protein